MQIRRKILASLLLAPWGLGFTQTTNGNERFLSGAMGKFQPQAKTSTAIPGVDFLIFVSASMPTETILNYSRQANKYGATIVLKGFVNDKSSSTREFIQSLNEGGAGWMIHPNSFKLFKIDKVPAIVLANAERSSLTEEGCAQERDYAKISGDISLAGALDLFSTRAQAPFAGIAQNIILKDRRAAQQQPLK